MELWLRDLENPLRWGVRPVLQFLFAVLLHVTWFLKRLPLPQFRAHRLLQRTICWFCRNFVSVEANQLILRHYATESNILNFLRDNSADRREAAGAVSRSRSTTCSGTRSSITTRNCFASCVRWGRSRARANVPQRPARSSGTIGGRSDATLGAAPRRWTQVIDFETSHALFMCLFCALLTAEEYRDAINGFNLDQSIALRIAALLG